MEARPQSTGSSWLALQCEGCGAQLQVEPGHRTVQCPYCAAPAVVERPVDTQRPEPTFALGFVVTQEAALETARKWIKGTWFTPSSFRRATLDNTRGVYVPAYLYSAEAHVQYSASIGENYTVTETYTDSNGKTRTRTKTKTEWRSLQGQWASYVDDLLVTASGGLPNAELEAVEPFDLRALRRYTPKIVSGWIAEDPSLSESHCMELGRKEAVESIGGRLGAHMPGDKHTDLRYQSRLHNEDIELVLLPIWVLAVKYHDEKPPVRLVINGQTRHIHGRPPRSWLKITITALGVIGALAAIYLFLSLS